MLRKIAIFVTMKCRRFIISCIVCLCLSTGFAQVPLRLMEWNVENLFDCLHDTLKQDHEFLPESERHWTWGRYWRKQEDLARVIMAVGESQPVDIVALCEVENDSVLRDLTRRGALRSLGYQYVVTSSPDLRGVDVALLYQPMRFRLLGSESRRVPSAENVLRPTRDLLHAWGVVPDGDTLHIVVCHFPSRVSGREGDRNRLLAAQTLASLCDSLGRDCPLVVMGDFNAPARDRIFRHLSQLVDLVPQSRRPKEGTYRYRGEWSWIDHVLVSPSLVSRCSPLCLYTAPWLQDPDSHGGWHPRRTYLGPAYHAGVSDHVPLYFDLSLQ